MYLETGRPFRGAARARVEAFLQRCGLDYDAGVDFTATLVEDGEIIASGSLDGATLKCIAVSPEHQGEDLSARLLTELRREAFDRGLRHLMLFTKPGNRMLFQDLGFYPVVQSAGCLLMENRKNGLSDYLAALSRPETDGVAGCIVANCNPFTLGHRYLIETAAAQCGALHLFVLSEAKGMFSPEARLEMVRAGCADLPNVYTHPTGPYMVSSATFPDYFIKDKSQVQAVHCGLDVRLFGEKIAPALGVARRYVGTEPLCPVTRAYNAEMKAQLPEWGVEVIEIPRRELDGAAVSASRVRALYAEGALDAVRRLVPKTTYDFLIRLKP